MKIGMVLDSLFPHDNRVEKEALSLIAAGHNVYLLCYTEGNEPLEEIWNGIRINRIKLSSQKAKKMMGLIFVLPFYRIFWKNKILNFVTKNTIDVLHVHDLPLCEPALIVREKTRVKVICDMHEDFANWIVITPLYTKGLKQILKYFGDWKKHERDCLQLCDGIVGVSEPLVKKMIADYQLKQPIVNIPNTPDLSVFQIDRMDTSMKAEMESHYNLIYSGMIDPLRGLQFVIPLLLKLKETIPEIRLVIVGDGRYLDELKNITAEYNLHKHVLFTGFLSMEKIAGYIHYSQIGLNPQRKYKGIDEAIATKLYQYCAMGIPVISSAHKMPHKFIEHFNCGFVVDFENDSDTFIEQIFTLYQNPKLREDMGNSGKIAVLENYNWEKTVRPLIDLYSMIK